MDFRVQPVQVISSFHVEGQSRVPRKGLGPTTEQKNPCKPQGAFTIQCFTNAPGRFKQKGDRQKKTLLTVIFGQRIARGHLSEKLPMMKGKPILLSVSNVGCMSFEGNKD
ncbi:hypothetical protein PoB_001245000 [Plakobranchus ocellatus]|uniref:Uncharacterized protein n=1 Tax=Plakobranchus ocellatus TaxID=259542 RepID=A0AAV3YU43_9GAST|nr:hypothetical protein PoB_001245000 [Plakobranchus ocellatus]